MTKRAWLWISVAVVYTTVIGLVFFSWGTFSHSKQSEQVPISQTTVEESAAAAEVTPTPSPEPVCKYTVKELDGQVVVYHNDQILKKLSIDLSLLPAENRRLLKEGITVDSEEKLAELLEDYSELGE